MSTAAESPRPHLRGPDLRVPDERPRLRAAERPAGGRGVRRGGPDNPADVVVFNTCAVRENADNKLYGNLGQLASVKAENPACRSPSAAAWRRRTATRSHEGAVRRRRLRHPQHRLAAGAARTRAGIQEEAQVEILESLSVFPSTLPTKRDSAYAAWVSISVGCNNTCTFCIVPACVARRRTAGPGEILAEIEALVADGVIEVTLLGQNVNSYGVEFGDRQAFGKLLRACGEIDGLERVRFTRPHPEDFTDDVIAAMAETPNVMPSCTCRCSRAPTACSRRCAGHTAGRSSSASSTASAPRCPTRRSPPTSSWGSPARPRRTSWRRWTSCGRRASQRVHLPVLPRPGTPAAELDEQVPKDVVQDRYERLVEVVNEIAWDEGKALVGRSVELLVAEREGRKDGATHRLTGRGPDNRLVHFGPSAARPSPGRHGGRRDHVGRAAPPGRRRPDPLPYAARAPATRGSAATPRRSAPTGIGLGMPTSVCRPRCAGVRLRLSRSRYSGTLMVTW